MTNLQKDGWTDCQYTHDHHVNQTRDSHDRQTTSCSGETQSTGYAVGSEGARLVSIETHTYTESWKVEDVDSRWDGGADLDWSNRSESGSQRSVVVVTTPAGERRLDGTTCETTGDVRKHYSGSGEGRLDETATRRCTAGVSTDAGHAIYGTWCVDRNTLVDHGNVHRDTVKTSDCGVTYDVDLLVVARSDEVGYTHCEDREEYWRDGDRYATRHECRTGPDVDGAPVLEQENWEQKPWDQETSDSGDNTTVRAGDASAGKACTQHLGEMYPYARHDDCELVYEAPVAGQPVSGRLHFLACDGSSWGRGEATSGSTSSCRYGATIPVGSGLYVGVEQETTEWWTGANEHSSIRHALIIRGYGVDQAASGPALCQPSLSCA